MSPDEVPIAAATSRTVVDARPFSTATPTAASMIASRRASGAIRFMARSVGPYCANVQ